MNEVTEKMEFGGIEVVTAEEVKVVKKPWGREGWMANPMEDGDPSLPYAFKTIFIKAPHKTSLQFHEKKRESNYLVNGTGVLHYHPDPIDIQRYVNSEYSESELQEIIDGVQQMPISPGTVIHIKPGFIHRIEATTEDLLFHEVSTTELDDVYRLKDDSKRGSGRIAEEHK